MTVAEDREERRVQAERAVMAWLGGMGDRLDYDDSGPGTASRELYGDFADHCRHYYGPAFEVPSETLWGRILTEECELPARRTAHGSRRALRLLAGRGVA